MNKCCRPWLALGIVIGMLISAILVTAAFSPVSAACIPDTAIGPTPCLEFVHDMVGVTGVRVWYRPLGFAWHISRSVDLPCQQIRPEDGSAAFQICRGVRGTLPYPVQRSNNYQLEWIEYAVSLYGPGGESPISEPEGVCMSGTWALR